MILFCYITYSSIFVDTGGLVLTFDSVLSKLAKIKP